MGTFCVFVLFSSSLRYSCRSHFHQVSFSFPMFFIFFLLFRNKSTFKIFTTTLYSSNVTWQKPEQKNSSPIPKIIKKKKSSALLTAGAKAWKWEAVAAPEEIPNIQHAPSQWVLPTQTPSTVGNICLQTQRFATAAMSSQALRGSSGADTASTGKCKICLGTARKAVVELSSGGVWEKHYGQKIGDAFVREDTVWKGLARNELPFGNYNHLYVACNPKILNNIPFNYYNFQFAFASWGLTTLFPCRQINAYQEFTTILCRDNKKGMKICAQRAIDSLS